MKPAFSLIVFTVSSGAGLGLLAWLVVSRLVAEQAHYSASLVWGAALGLGLLGVGLIASSLHLANRANAWRAFSGWRSSWLAREAIAALAVWPVAALWLYGAWSGRRGLETVAGLLVLAVLSWTLWSTAMIYACLRTIPRWHSWHTRAGFPLYACVSGGLLWWAVIAATDAARLAPLERWRGLLTVLIACAAFLKYAHWKAFAGRRPGAISSAAALGLRGRASLFDAGHTGPTFLTREFGYVLDPNRATLLRWIALLLAFAGPALLIGWPAVGTGMLAGLAASAAGLALVGLALERWLFFAEAEHVVRLYHGAGSV